MANFTRETVMPVCADGVWTWFNDNRACFLDERTVAVGYVRRDGRVAVTVLDTITAAATEMVLSSDDATNSNDHNNPSLTRLSDGRLLAVYSLHGARNQYHWRICPSPMGDAATWTMEQTRTLPATTTYSNTFQLSADGGQIFNFHRCLNWNPCVSLSRDAESWSDPVQIIKTGSGKIRPYMRLCSDGESRIDMIYTDHHPNNFNNSVYHLFYSGGDLHASDGTVLGGLLDGPLDHDAGQRGTAIYTYSKHPLGEGDIWDDRIPGGRAWIWDIARDCDGHPVCVFQLRRGDVTGQGWEHDRIYYFYARWNGRAWVRRFIAQAGRPLYDAERDYAGGIALDPQDPGRVIFSSNAAAPFDLTSCDDVPLQDPPLCHLYEAVFGRDMTLLASRRLTDGGNALRPKVVGSPDRKTSLILWVEGDYTTYKVFRTAIMALAQTRM